MSEAPLLSVQDLSVAFSQGGGQSTAVDHISFDIAKGETVALVGESGSGKSVSALSVLKLLPYPSASHPSGKIVFQGNDLLAMGEKQLRQVRGNKITMIFQEPMTSLNPLHTIEHQIVEILKLHQGMADRPAKERTLALLNEVGIRDPHKRLDAYPHQLSGGQRQRVMIAMALANEPELLIADEPTTALDVTVQGEVLELLRDLQRQHGTSVILITHDMGVVAEMADRVIIMRHGRMVEEGKTADIFARPQAGYTRELLAAVPRIGSGIGRQESRSAETATPANVADVKDLHVRFDLHGGFFGRVTRRVHAVEGVSFSIAPNETLALVGESGCGKSTTAKALAGLVPYSGDIAIGGRNLSGLGRDERKAVRRDVQMIFQDPYASLDPRMRVGDLVAEPLLIHGIASKEERSERVAALFERVGLSPDQMELYPHEFSGGQRQRVCIARALALRPKLIIADESVSALDVSVQARVLDLLKELQREFGVAYLFISHDMAVVENISDRVAVMYLGQIVEMGTRDQVFSNPRHPYTRRLIEAVPVPDPAQRRSRFARLDQEIPSATRRIGEAPLKLALRDVGNGHLVAVEG